MGTFGLYMIALLHVNPGPTGCWASALPLSCTPCPEQTPSPGSHIILTVQARLGSNPRNQPGSASKGQHDQKPDSSLRWTKRLHLSRFALTSQTQALRLTIICPPPPPCAVPCGFGTMGMLVPGGWSWSKAGITTAVPELAKIVFSLIQVGHCARLWGY